MGRYRQATPAVEVESEVPEGFAALATAAEESPTVEIAPPSDPPKVSPRRKYDVLFKAGKKQLAVAGIEAVDESEAIQRAILKQGISLVEVSKLRFEVAPSGNAA